MTELRKRNSSISTHSERKQEDVNDVVELKKEVGLIGGISLVVGSIIGSGIFMSPSTILVNVGSLGASLCVWAGCGVLATLSAVSYIELGLMIRKSGAEYPYLRAAYGDVMGYLLAWTNIIVTKPSVFALISIGFAEYVTAPFYPGCAAPSVIQKLAAAFCILTISTINCFSVKVSNFIQIFFTAAKLLIIAAIIIGGFVMLGQGNTENFQNSFEGTEASFSAIALGFYSGLFSYDGWNQLNFVTEELKTPRRNFPLTIWIGIPMVTILYILVNIAYFTVMTPNEIINSPAVAITFGYRVFGPAAFVVPIAVACSTFGAANGSAFTTGRLTYAAARNGHMLQIFSYISVTRYTPSPALIFNTFVALLMILPDTANFATLIDYFTFASWLFYGATFLAIIVLRFKHPDWERPYKVWIVVPAICTLISAYLIIGPIIENPSYAYLIAALFILAGLLLYFPLVYFKKVPGFMEPLTRFLQEVLEVVPPPEEDADEDNNDEIDKLSMNSIPKTATVF